MSNETKRDVFENALDELLLSKDDGALDAELRCRYDAAVPDDLPVIPQAVAYAIEWFQQNDETIGEVWRNLYEDVDDDWHECPQLREAEEWMLDNQDTFTRAWVLGQWEAEK
ncbi:DUF1642 domain-containing protein [Lacticaseibacillus sp. 866-1]|uniref:DUF1642 domain-containing protein n=1 Tax=Lacticaseibacillus sp. 866-1 TaxID=2799576 RepID=UPI0019440DF6|nr:DUF1642 domain-containing protein [Lacticaseibacillus sp. 866-1]